MEQYDPLVHEFADQVEAVNQIKSFVDSDEPSAIKLLRIRRYLKRLYSEQIGFFGISFEYDLGEGPDNISPLSQLRNAHSSEGIGF